MYQHVTPSYIVKCTLMNYLWMYSGNTDCQIGMGPEWLREQETTSICLQTVSSLRAGILLRLYLPWGQNILWAFKISVECGTELRSGWTDRHLLRPRP